MLIWKEKNPVRGTIRRSIMAVWQWLKVEALPTLVVLAVMGHMIMLTLITIGEYPSGPVAALSSSPRAISSTITGHDPYTIASRADHGHFVSGGE